MTDERPKRSRAKPAAAAEPEQPQYAPECYACPIGTVSMALQRSAPETTEHLVRAGRELLLALRGMVDGLGEFLTAMEERSASARQPAGVQSIPIRRRS